MTPQTTQSNIEVINDLQRQKFPGSKEMGQKDWDRLKSFFTDDVVYRPGALAERGDCRPWWSTWTRSSPPSW